MTRPHTQLLIDSLQVIIPRHAPVRDVLNVDELLALHDRDPMQDFQRDTPCNTADLRTSLALPQPTVFTHHSFIRLPGVFGMPLHQVAVYASTTALVGGRKHNLPIVVFACVEELYRTGMQETTIELLLLSSCESEPTRHLPKRSLP